MDLFLDRQQVIDLIHKAGGENEVVVVRCVRKGPASKPNGPDAGDLYDLHVAPKPKDYERKTDQDRGGQDSDNGVLTVWVTNREEKKGSGKWGAWRRVNIVAVKKVIYQNTEYEVVSHQ